MFKKISLITNSDSEKVAETLQFLIDFLKEKDIEIELDECSARVLQQTDLPVATAEQIGASSDLAIAVGGDGTMLKAAHLVCAHDIPLLGINRGRLGFLADIAADSVKQHMEEILQGKYVEDPRFLLYSEVM